MSDSTGERSDVDPKRVPALLDRCMVIDRVRLGRQARELARQAGDSQESAQRLTHLIGILERSAERRAQRERATPRPVYPDDLPVVQARQKIAEAIRRNQVVVVCGATGSGKTTQLPKICLELGRGAAGMIGHTQPRRIAARSVAARVADELGTSLGGIVGYKVRFTDQVSRGTLVKLMTDGILLSEAPGDRLLAQYDTLIVDEAHERSLNIDFLLGYLRQLLPKRPDLKVIVTSATIDPQSFAEHFADPRTGRPAPVIEVSGRTFPVEVRYRPLSRGDEDEREIEMEHAVVEAAAELIGADRAEGGGGKGRDRDILVFLPGEREIRETADELRKSPVMRDAEILPLFARLSTEEQNRVFQPHDKRRIVLATNVAETSLTVPGIKYVIDSGLARVSRYSPRTKVQRLPVEAISQASAQQRSGRCGRTSPGIAVRLYSEADFDARPVYTDPEILRTNLASVILQMKALGLAADGDVAAFPFMQPPNPGAVRDGYDTLIELGALDSGGELTPTGRKLARLPVDPRIGRMILAGEEERCLADVLVIAAALSVQDPRERPPDRQAEADVMHEKWKHEESDFLALTNLWRGFRGKERALSGGGLRKWCRENLLSYVRLREWQDVHRQLREMAEELGMNTRLAAGQGPSGYDQVHRALLTGLLSNIGIKAADKGGFEYDGVRGLKFSLFPGSALFRARPKWVMAAELVRTTRLYARTAARISPQWIERAAAHLVTRDYAEPHWSTDTAQVAAYETVTLFGLPIIKRRRMHYGPVDPAQSRTIFIEHALVKGEYLSSGRFLEQNFHTQKSIQRLEEKQRRADLLADPSARFAFYAEKLPQDVFDGPGFERWRSKAESRQPELLVIPRERMLAPGAAEPPVDQFPDALQIRAGEGSVRIPLEYIHKHNDPSDGVTAIIPLDLLGAIEPARFDWLVPGFAQELIVELIRAMPKFMRANLAPASGYAERAIVDLLPRFGQGDFLGAVSEALTRVAPEGVVVSRESLAEAMNATGQGGGGGLPAHLRMNFRIVEQLPGKPVRVVASGRDLGRIKRDLMQVADRAASGVAAGPLNRGGITHWDFGNASIPMQADLPYGKKDGGVGGGASGVLRVWIGLADETPFGRAEPSVGVRPYADAGRARESHRAGVIRLLAMDVQKEARSLIDTIPGIERVLVLGSTLIHPDIARRDLAELAALESFASLDGSVLEAVRDRERFRIALDAGWDRLGGTGRRIASLAESIFAAHQRLSLVLDSAPTHWTAPLADVRHQLGALFLGRFLVDTPYRWLVHFPRYLDGVRRRLERIAFRGPHDAEGLNRDAQRMNELLPLWSACVVRLQHTGGLRGRWDASELSEFRWLIEELRISLFAEDLRTLTPVSVKRLSERWREIADDGSS